jgi:hypothetical protein
MTDQLGQAWFSPDAQWWIGEPARLGEVMTLRCPELPFELTWASESVEATGASCDEMQAAYADEDGFMVRQIDFIVERSQLDARLFPVANPAQVACAHFDCVEPVEPGACETRCPAWRLPFVIGFEHQLELCR